MLQTTTISPVEANRLVAERCGTNNAHFVEAAGNVFSAVLALVDNGYTIQSVRYGSAYQRPRILLQWEPALANWAFSPVVTRVRLGQRIMIQSTLYRGVQVEWARGVH